jgi:chromosome partitioning protein
VYHCCVCRFNVKALERIDIVTLKRYDVCMIVAVINEKGGVGKTTTVATLGHALELRGERILVIDLDPQANLTAWIGTEHPPRGSVANALADRTVIVDAIGGSTAGLVALAYGSRAVADAADDLRASSPAPALALRRALRGLDYDRILIDCPPGLGVLSVNALCAADELIIPVNSQAMALSGVVQLEATLEELRDAEVIQREPVRRLLMTMYDSRRALAREVREYLNGRGPRHVYETTIRASARIAECYGHHRTIYDYAPREGVAADYARLAEEVQLAVAPR